MQLVLMIVVLLGMQVKEDRSRCQHAIELLGGNLCICSNVHCSLRSLPQRTPYSLAHAHDQCFYILP